MDLAFEATLTGALLEKIGAGMPVGCIVIMTALRTRHGGSLSTGLPVSTYSRRRV